MGIRVWLESLGKDEVKVHYDTPYVPPPKPKSVEEEFAEAIAELAALKEELRLRRIKDAEDIQKPDSTYRIVKMEYARGEGGEDGYFVQRWYVSQGAGYGYEQDWRFNTNDDYEHYSRTLGPKYFLDRTRRHIKDIRATPQSTTIQWHNVGSANPHPTFEEAKKWLKKWLNPKAQEAFFDDDGNQINT